MSKTFAYVGTYTSGSSKGIYACEWDKETGKLEPFCAAEVENPSFLAFSHDLSRLFCVVETGSFGGRHGGGVASFAVDRSTGRLRAINAQPTLGAAPCYVSVSRGDNFLLAANYGEGTVTAFPIGKDGAVAPHSCVAVHTGTGPDASRQEGPHAHCATFTPDGKYVCAVDLGIDTIKVYTLDAEGKLHPDDSRSVAYRPGAGPRHLVFSPDALHAYAIGEMGSCIAVFDYDGDGHFTPKGYVSTLPDDFHGVSIGAALHFSPDGRFLCASNRGHDSIAVFRVGSDGALTAAGRYPVGGKFPRDFTFSPDGKYVYAANQSSDTVTTLRFDGETGALTQTGNALSLGSPVFLTFVTFD